MIPSLKKFTEAMDKYGGNITFVAKAFGVRRSTVYNWIKERPEFQQIVDEARESLCDLAEYSTQILLAGVRDKDGTYLRLPDPGTVRYILGTLGRKRGYGEHIDVTSNGESLNSKEMTPEKAKEYIAKLEMDY